MSSELLTRAYDDMDDLARRNGKLIGNLSNVLRELRGIELADDFKGRCLASAIEQARGVLDQELARLPGSVEVLAA